MRFIAIGLCLALLPGCVVEGGYASDGINVTGYACRVLISGEYVRINSMDVECRGAKPPAFAGGILPVGLPAR